MLTAKLSPNSLLFAIAILLLIGVDAMSVWTENRNAKASDLVSHTYQVINATRSIGQELSTHTTQGDGLSASQISESRSRVSRELELLRRLVLDNQRQINRFDQLESIIDRRWGILAAPAGASARTAGTSPLSAHAEADANMEQIRSKIGEIVTEESQLLETRQSLVRRFRAWAHASILVGSVLGLSLLVLVVYRLTTETRELKRLQSALHTSELVLQGIVSNTTQAVTVRDLEGRYLLANDAALALLGKPREEVIGQPESSLAWQAATSVVGDMAKEAIRTGRPVERTQELFDGDRVRSFILVRFPIWNDEGDVTAIGGVSTEVTEIRRAQLAADNAREEADVARRIAEEASREAERANAAKSEFLSRMSHELRTPMNAILGFAQLLQMDNTTPAQREHVEQILRGGRHLLALINDILDLSRVESGEFSLSLEPVRVDEAAAEAISMVRTMIERRGLSLHQETDGSPLCVRADRQRLRQTLMNLISNAIKYNVDGGQIWIRAHEEDGLVSLDVIDNGSGVPPDKVERLFIPFDRLGAENLEIEGTGLGLSLCRSLTVAMRGSLRYTPNPAGRGSIFSIVLPKIDAQSIASAETASRVDSMAITLTSDRNLLCIEDNLANVQLFEALLGNREHVRLIVAMQGRMGLDLAREHLPDAVLLDLNLPDLSGAQVYQQLREIAGLERIPIIVVSADATEKQIRRMMELGAFAYLTKPFDLKGLIGTLRDALQDTP